MLLWPLWVRRVRRIEQGHCPALADDCYATPWLRNQGLHMIHLQRQRGTQAVIDLIAVRITKMFDRLSEADRVAKL